MNNKYPIYYLMLDQHDVMTRDQLTTFYFICTISGAKQGAFRRIGLHRIQVHEETWAIQEKHKNVLGTIQKSIQEFCPSTSIFVPEYVRELDNIMLESAKDYVVSYRNTRLSEIRSSCAQRSIARAWRKCVSDPTYKVCIARLAREFNNMF